MKLTFTKKEEKYFYDSFKRKNPWYNSEFDQMIRLLEKEKLVKYFIRKEKLGRIDVRGNKSIKLTRKGKLLLMILREPVNNEDAKWTSIFSLS